MLVDWLCVALGVGRQALHPPPPPPLPSSQLPWFHQRQPRVPRRKRDCTLALFFTTSTGTSATSPCTSEEEGLHLRPLPRDAGVYFGRGGTGPPPHDKSEYFVFSRFVYGSAQPVYEKCILAPTTFSSSFPLSTVCRDLGLINDLMWDHFKTACGKEHIRSTDECACVPSFGRSRGLIHTIIDQNFSYMLRSTSLLT